MATSPVAVLDRYRVSVTERPLATLLADLYADSDFNTQRELADAADISESTVSRLLSGSPQTTTENLDKLAAALGVEPRILHRAYADQQGWMIDEIPTDDPNLKAIIVRWASLPPEVQASYRASVVEFVREHRKLVGKRRKSD